MKRRHAYTDDDTRRYYRTEAVVAEYDRVRFAGAGGRLLKALQEELFFQVLPEESLLGKRVLDLGCGTGRFLACLKGLDVNLVGIDASPAMIRAAERDVDTVHYALGDALALPFEDDAFDVAYSAWVINHIPQYHAAIAEMCRVSRHVVLAVPNADSLFKLTNVFKRLGGPVLVRRQSATGISKSGEAPFSTNFVSRQLTGLLDRLGFETAAVRRGLLLPFVPGLAAWWYPWLERRLAPLSRRFGTFMVISAKKVLPPSGGPSSSQNGAGAGRPWN